MGGTRSDKVWSVPPVRRMQIHRLSDLVTNSPIIQTQTLLVFLSDTLDCIFNISVHWLLIFFLPSMTRQKKYGTIHEKKTIKNKTQENRNNLSGSIIYHEKLLHTMITSDHFRPVYFCFRNENRFQRDLPVDLDCFFNGERKKRKSFVGIS